MSSGPPDGHEARAISLVYQYPPSLAGTADLLVTKGEFPVDQALVKEIVQVPGVKSARARLFERVKLPELGNRPVLLIGLDLIAEAVVGASERDRARRSGRRGLRRVGDGADREQAEEHEDHEGDAAHAGLPLWDGHNVVPPSRCAQAISA